MKKSMFEVASSSGRATCQVCSRLIRKHETQFRASAPRMSGSAHGKCILNLLYMHVRKLVEVGQC